MKLRSIVFGLAFLGLSVATLAAKENFADGSTWTGIMRTAHVSNRTKKTTSTESFDVKLVIKTVDDNGKFTGEFYKDRDRYALEIEGKINKKGVIAFTPVKEIKGGWANNVVGNWTFAATLRGKQIAGRASIPSTGNTYTYLSEYNIKLKE
jgi:hypothetical protein